VYVADVQNLECHGGHGAGVPTLFADAADLSYRSDAFAMATPRSSGAEPAAFSLTVSDTTTSPVDERGACTSRAATHAQLNAEITKLQLACSIELTQEVLLCTKTPSSHLLIMMTMCIIACVTTLVVRL